MLKRSKPLFKILPFEEIPADLLDRASALKDNGQKDLQEISSVVQDLRGGKVIEICKNPGGDA